MKDRLIFLISLILVVAGVSYLGFTAYQFFTRDKAGVPEQVAEGPSDSQQSTEDIALVGASNKELVGEGKKIGEEVSINAKLKNNSDTRISTNLEGRIYKIEELYTFPDVESSLPIDVKTMPVTLNAEEEFEYTYTYKVNECAQSPGGFYIALASAEYWRSGRGLVSYGYYTAVCESIELAQPTPSASVTPTPSPTPAKIQELPKAGAGENMILLGFAALLLGVAVRLNIVKIG